MPVKHRVVRRAARAQHGVLCLAGSCPAARTKFRGARPTLSMQRAPRAAHNAALKKERRRRREGRGSDRVPRIGPPHCLCRLMRHAQVQRAKEKKKKNKTRKRVKFPVSNKNSSRGRRHFPVRRAACSGVARWVRQSSAIKFSSQFSLGCKQHYGRTIARFCF